MPTELLNGQSQEGRYKKYKTDYFSRKAVKKREGLRSKKQRKEEIAKYKLEVAFTQLPRTFKLISDFLLWTEDGYRQIHHLLISPYGLFIIEGFNLAGLIVGDGEDSVWVQKITWRVKTFPNPLLENQKTINLLREKAKIDESVPFFSYVTFSRRCKLKVIWGTVFYDTDLLDYLEQLLLNRSPVLTEEEVDELYERLAKLNIRDLQIRQEQFARKRREVIRQRPSRGNLRCHICQKPISERLARYCLNRPEKFDWKLYCEKHQKEVTRTVPRFRRRIMESEDR